MVGYFIFIIFVEPKQNKMIDYLGQIEIGNKKVKAHSFVNPNAKEHEMYSGFILEFFEDDSLTASCELLDDDHVSRELTHLGYNESFINVILSML